VDTGTPVKEVVEAEPVRAETPAASPGAPNRSPLQLSPTTGTALASPQALQASAAAAAATGKTSSAGQGDPLSAAVAAMAETPSKGVLDITCNPLQSCNGQSFVVARAAYCLVCPRSGKLQVQAHMLRCCCAATLTLTLDFIFDTCL